MTRLLHILLALTIVSCGKTKSQEQVSTNTDKSQTSLVPVSTAATSPTSGQDTSQAHYQEGMTATYYVVVADTGVHYVELRKQMFAYQHALQQSVDTMGRSYNKAKDLIALPENSEDKIYAGDYYPRRFPSSTLSIEYLDFYREKSSDKSMALVTGIYEQQRSADSALTILKKFSPKAFVVKSDIYVDCLH